MASLSLVFDLLARDNASPGFRSAGESAEQAHGKVSAFGSGIVTAMKVAGGAIAAAGIVEGFKSFYNAAAESQKIANLTQAAITSTGGAAKITAQQVSDLATSISNKTGVDDEAIQSGANLLLTFTNVRNEAGKGNDIFNQTTSIMTDMAAVLGTDASGSAIQLGKALNDPVAGITALTRVGVSFTEQQKDQIKTLAESGDTLGAQKVILAELSKEFGGAAAAASTPMDKLKVNLGNLQEQIGGYLIPVVDKFATFALTKLLPGVQAVGSVASGALALFKTANTEGGIAGFFQGVGANIEAAFPIVRAALADMAVALWDWIQPQIPPALRQLGVWLDALGQWLIDTGLPKLGAWLAAVGVALYQWIQPMLLPALQQLGVWAAALGLWLLNTGLPMLGAQLLEWGKALVDWIGPQIPPLLGELAKLIGQAAGWLLFTGLPMLVIALNVLAFELIKWILPQIPGLLANMLEFIGKLVWWLNTTAVPWLIREFFNLAVSMLGGFWDAIEQSPVFQKVSQFFSDLKDDVKRIVGELVTDIGTIWTGIENVMATPINWVIQYIYMDGIRKVWNTVATKLGVDSLDSVSLLHFASGGVVPGNHERDDVPIFATPGEVVVPRNVVDAYGGGKRLMSMLGFGGGGGAGGHYFLGGIVGDVTGAISDAFDALGKAARGGLAAIARPIVHGFESLADRALSGTGFDDLLNSGVHTLGDKLIDWIAGDDAKNPPMASTIVSSAVGGVEQWRSAVDFVLGMLGLPTNLDNGVLNIIAFESGGNPNAINLWDSNAQAGHPSQGLMQTIPSTFQAYRSINLPDNILDPYSNIYAGVNYALQRYGTSFLAAGGNHGPSGNYIGYALGTNYVPKTGPALLHEGEAVVPRNENARARFVNDALLAEIQGMRQDMAVLTAAHATAVVDGYKSSVDDQARLVSMGGSRRPQ